MRVLVVASVLLFAMGCADVPFLGPCAGQAPECRQAVEIARRELPKHFAAPAVTATHVQGEPPCEKEPGQLPCDEVLYAVQVIFTMEGRAEPFVVHVAQLRDEPMHAWQVDNAP